MVSRKDSNTSSSTSFLNGKPTGGLVHSNPHCPAVRCGWLFGVASDGGGCEVLLEENVDVDHQLSTSIFTGLGALHLGGTHSPNAAPGYDGGPKIRTEPGEKNMRKSWTASFHHLDLDVFIHGYFLEGAVIPQIRHGTYRTVYGTMLCMQNKTMLSARNLYPLTQACSSKVRIILIGCSFFIFNQDLPLM